jgi:hypothetical protein
MAARATARRRACHAFKGDSAVYISPALTALVSDSSPGGFRRISCWTFTWASGPALPQFSARRLASRVPIYRRTLFAQRLGFGAWANSRRFPPLLGNGARALGVCVMFGPGVSRLRPT